MSGSAERASSGALRRLLLAAIVAGIAALLPSIQSPTAAATATFGSIGPPPLPAHPKRSTASCYGNGDGLLGNYTASGLRLTRRTLGVAHKTMPLGSKILIAANRRRVVVEVVDRGPFVHGRELDLTIGAVRSLGYPTCKAWGVRTIKTWNTNQ